MTHAAPRRPVRVPKVWLIPGVAIALIIVATSVRLLSRSILIDFVAWTPLWVSLLLLGLATRGRRIAAIRVSGLISLALLAGIAAFMLGHLQGWPLMPSSTAHLIGTADALVETAALSARIDGRLDLSVGSPGRHLYDVAPIRGGGDVGIPTALERTQGSSTSVELTEPADPGLYQFAGWELRLSPRPVWTLSLKGVIDADLSLLSIESLQVEGSGIVRIGVPEESSPVATDGVFTIEVAAGSAVRVIGPANVPRTWISNENGFESPQAGPGWVIAISEGSVVHIVETSLAPSSTPS